MENLLKVSIFLFFIICSPNFILGQRTIQEYNYRQDIGSGFYVDLKFIEKAPIKKSKIEGGVYWNGIKLGRTDVYWRDSKQYLRIEWTGAYHGIKIYFKPGHNSVRYKLGTQNVITYEWQWWKKSKHLFSF